MAEAAKVLAFAGKTREEISACLGVNPTTFYRWLKTKPALRNSIDSAGDLAHGKVALSLFERACGYTHPEEVLRYDTREGEWVRAATSKHYPPDTAAALAWLQNRQPERWRARTETDLNVNLTVRRALLELED